LHVENLIFRENAALKPRAEGSYRQTAEKEDIMKYGELTLGQIEAVVNKLGGMDGVKKLLADEMRFEVKNEILKLISAGENVAIGPTDGTEILAKAKDIFTWIDSDFVDYGADEPGQATLETSVRVYEMAKDATFAQMFSSLSSDLDRLCLTQAQIKSFAKSHRNWLRSDGYATFFLFKSHGHFFVAGVFVNSYGELEANVGRFEDGNVWGAGGRGRVVVP